MNVNIKAIATSLIVSLVLGATHHVQAQCTTTVTHKGMGCIGDTFIIDSKGAARIDWQRNGHSIKSIIPYIPSAYGSTVAGYSKDTAGTDSTRFDYPLGVSVDRAGNVYVADFYNNRIQRWAPGAKYGITVAGQKDGTAGGDSTQLYYPSGVCVDNKGNIYIADEFNCRVQKWAPGAKYGVTVAGQQDGTAGYDSAHLYFPNGLYVDTGGTVYVADYNRVQRWAPGATFGVTVAGRADGTPGHDSTYLSNSVGVFVDANYNVFVADADNNRVTKWTPGAKFGITVAGQKYDTTLGGHDSTRLMYPYGVYVDVNSNVYVADADNNRVQKWTPGAKYGITVAGNKKDVSGGDSAHFSYAVGLYVDSVGTIYVSDAGNNRVQQWTQSIPEVMEVADSAGLYNAVIRFKSGCADTTQKDTIKNCATGVADLTAAAGLRMYPNPTNGGFTLDMHTANTTDAAHVQILNMLGQPVAENVVDNNNGWVYSRYTRTDLPTGLYMVKITIAHTTYTNRVTVIK